MHARLDYLKRQLRGFGVDIVYQVLDKVEVRSKPSVEDACRAGLSYSPGDLVHVDYVLFSSADSNYGPYMRLTDGTGWLFEKKNGKSILSPATSIERGLWAY